LFLYSLKSQTAIFINGSKALNVGLKNWQHFNSG
jgi:hypothetical protein